VIVRLLEVDGRTLVAALDVPRVDDVPKVAVWNERAFMLLSATHSDTVAVNYVETVSLRLELPAESGR
jgi:hypothetical protein